MSKENQTFVEVAVCGAHMSGLPLNVQLTSLAGELVSKTTTAPYYRLYKLNGFTPERPGLLRVKADGQAIALEVWRLPVTNYGAFVAGVPAPLGFGTLVLQDGSQVQGFLCEAYATEDAIDISAYGGWRDYLTKKDA
ncbi:amidase [Methylovorus sp. MM2]|uniref:allophanate hydrolase-related protein n=1 Tax=Methylovorus sp. MM2 TaxID=1848038 RepID=UPI0007DE63C8|nr:amidase [Methylovorus sp. MM2]OAM52644.1 amidase [Methylovorus sp. MM2]